MSKTLRDVGADCREFAFSLCHTDHAAHDRRRRLITYAGIEDRPSIGAGIQVESKVHTLPEPAEQDIAPHAASLGGHLPVGGQSHLVAARCKSVEQSRSHFDWRLGEVSANAGAHPAILLPRDRPVRRLPQSGCVIASMRRRTHVPYISNVRALPSAPQSKILTRVLSCGGEIRRVGPRN